MSADSLIVRHYGTGRTYRVITQNAKNTSNGCPAGQFRTVVYVDSESGAVFTRSHSEFWAYLSEEKRPRFEVISGE